MPFITNQEIAREITLIITDFQGFDLKNIEIQEDPAKVPNHYMVKYQTDDDVTEYARVHISRPFASMSGDCTAQAVSEFHTGTWPLQSLLHVDQISSYAGENVQWG